MKPFDSRNEIRQLLPWYENGTLDAAEHEDVRALLATDLEANRQRREVRALRDALIDEPILASNMGLNLQRLNAQIGARRAVTYVPSTARWLALAACAALALGVATFFAGTRLAPYHTLTAPGAIDAATPAGADLIRVAAGAGVDAEALIRIAADPEVRVLSGPSEHGVATLAVPHARAREVVARLSADPRLRFVAAVAQ